VQTPSAPTLTILRETPGNAIESDVKRKTANLTAHRLPPYWTKGQYASPRFSDIIPLCFPLKKEHRFNWFITPTMLRKPNHYEYVSNRNRLFKARHSLW
jgi:hypothetical protein